jgi:hypothetical protein
MNTAVCGGVPSFSWLAVARRHPLGGVQELVPGAQLDAGPAGLLAGRPLRCVDRRPAGVLDDPHAPFGEQLVDGDGGRVRLRLEPARRGIYGGAVGYVSYTGNMDMAIAIRTLLTRGDTIHVQAGAGIVADSQPADEYVECVNKAGAVVAAVEMARRGLGGG